MNSGENLVLVGSTETQFLQLIGKFHGQENITQIETKQDEYDSAFEISKYAFEAVEVENRTWKMSQSTDKDEKDADEIGLVYDKKDKDNSSKLEEQKFKYENLRRIIKDKVKAFNKESIVMMGK